MRAIAAVFTGVLMLFGAERAFGEWARYEAGTYTIYTDLSEEQAREARVRMSKLGEEFRKQLAGVIDAPRERLPFYLYREEQDYLAAGGRAGTGGVFTGGKLMAVAGEKPNLQTWQLVQHEAFHQYSRAAAGDRLPIWLDEGLAEYFGESLFTGDEYVSGLLPGWRVDRVKRALPIDWKKLTSMTREQWGRKIDQANYDAAWAMVSYLMKTKEEPFKSSLKQVGQAATWDETLLTGCGTWWEKLSPEPTREMYASVVEKTVNAFLKREPAAQSIEQLRTAVSKWNMTRENWLPPGLLDDAIDLGTKMGTLKIENRKAVLRLQP